MATTRMATVATSHQHHAHHANPTATTTTPLMKKDVQVLTLELLKMGLLLEPDLGLDHLDVVMMMKILKNATVMMIESNKIYHYYYKCCYVSFCCLSVRDFGYGLLPTLPPPINWPTLPLSLPLSSLDFCTLTCNYWSCCLLLRLLDRLVVWSMTSGYLLY